MRPAWQRSRQISARYQGRCKGCAKRICAGDTVWYAKGAGVRCEVCGRHPAPGDDSPEASEANGTANGTWKPGPRAQKGADGVYRYEFASLDAAVKHARFGDAAVHGTDLTITGILAAHGVAVTGGGEGPGGGWTNHYNYARLAEDAANPPAHLLDAVNSMRQRMIDRVAPPNATRRRLRRGRDWGDDIDSDRFLARDPMMWNRVEREPQSKRSVMIGCNLAVNAGRKPEDLLWRGASALALADVLTQRGVNVGVVLFSSVGTPSSVVNRGVIKYMAKDPQMPLDLGALAFAMCEIAWFRLVAAVGDSKLWPGRLSGGLGSANPLPVADRRGLDFIIDEDVIGQTGAEQWLKAAIDKVKENENDSQTEAA